MSGFERYKRPPKHQRPIERKRRNCLACGRENVLLNKDGSLRKHTALGQDHRYEEWCPASGTALYNTPGKPESFVELSR